MEKPTTVLVLAGELGPTTYPGGFQQALAPLLSAARTARDLRVLISGSPRTTNSCYQQLEAVAHALDMIGVSTEVYREAGDNRNPYVDWLRCAHVIIVGNDSASMLSDAVASGKPTLLAAPARWQAAVEARLATSSHHTPRSKHSADVRDYQATLLHRGALRFLVDENDVTSPAPIQSSSNEWDAHAAQIADVVKLHFGRPGGSRSPTGRLDLHPFGPSRPSQSAPVIPPKQLDE